jgi:N-ethylmaleimide reductase
MKLNKFLKVFSASIIGNCGYTQETAETAIQEWNADIIAFGRSFISNPDLVERFLNGWSLAADEEANAEAGAWFSFEKEEYTDFELYKNES